MKRYSKSYISSQVFINRVYKHLNDERGNICNANGRKDFVPKRLTEELLPLCVFLKFFEKPGRSVRCKYFPNYQNFDAKIMIKGREVELELLNQFYYIEITTVFDNKEYLRREKISKDDSVFMGQNIEREKKSKLIISKPHVRDIDDYVYEISEKFNEQIQKKLNKPYNKNTILLVNINSEDGFTLKQWCLLKNEINCTSDILNKFSYVYFVDTFDNFAFNLTF